MQKQELIDKITDFRSSVDDYKNLILENKQKNLDEINRIRSNLNRTYASLERYIRKLGTNPMTGDHPKWGSYPAYGNAFTNDIPQRIIRSVGLVINDTDRILGKLDSIQQEELDKLINPSQNTETQDIDPENLVIKIKSIMMDVATGKARIEEKNEEYQSLYNKLDTYFKRAQIENPNKFSDLWEFYNYWSNKLPKYADRRVYIINLYKEEKAVKKTDDPAITINETQTAIDKDIIRNLWNFINPFWLLWKIGSVFCKLLKLCFKHKVISGLISGALILLTLLSYNYELIKDNLEKVLNFILG